VVTLIFISFSPLSHSRSLLRHSILLCVPVDPVASPAGFMLFLTSGPVSSKKAARGDGLSTSTVR
jgi:hypothetical protein